MHSYSQSDRNNTTAGLNWGFRWVMLLHATSFITVMLCAITHDWACDYVVFLHVASLCRVHWECQETGEGLEHLALWYDMMQSFK